MNVLIVAPHSYCPAEKSILNVRRCDMVAEKVAIMLDLKFKELQNKGGMTNTPKLKLSDEKVRVPERFKRDSNAHDYNRFITRNSDWRKDITKFVDNSVINNNEKLYIFEIHSFPDPGFGKFNGPHMYILPIWWEGQNLKDFPYIHPDEYNKTSRLNDAKKLTNNLNIPNIKINKDLGPNWGTLDNDLQVEFSHKKYNDKIFHVLLEFNEDFNDDTEDNNNKLNTITDAIVNFVNEDEGFSNSNVKVNLNDMYDGCDKDFFEVEKERNHTNGSLLFKKLCCCMLCLVLLLIVIYATYYIATHGRMIKWGVW